MSRMDHARAFRVLERLARDVQTAVGPAEARVQLLKVAAAELGAGSATFHEPGATRPAQAASIETPAGIVERYLSDRARSQRSKRRMFVALERAPAIDGEEYCARERQRLRIYEEGFRPQRGRRTPACWLR